MNAKSRGLGRGLGALIPASGSMDSTEGASQADAPSGLITISITDIVPNPRQPREVFSPESLGELAASIQEHGLIQPLIVSRSEDGTTFQLIAGERRWRASRLAGLPAVPVLVKEATPQQSLELALVENIQRADLNALEEADAFQALITDFGLSQAEVAERVGKSRTAVANVVRLLRLPDRVKTLLATGTLSEGHARALLGLPDEKSMIQAAEHVVARGLTVRHTEELVRRLVAQSAVEENQETPPDEADATIAIHTRHLEDDFRRALGTKVALNRSSRGGGRLVISFFSEEELQSIYEHIVSNE
jgi:ParB family transcriptional regulator, chromosome partitioning protein